jgi:apolipoprotein N-acyltransferase
MNQNQWLYNKINRIPSWIWMLLPSVLFFLAWHPVALTPLLFVSFLPFLVLSNRFVDSRWYKYYGALFFSILGWNITTTWWVYYASAPGAVAMLILNSLFMLIPFAIVKRLKRNNYSNSWTWSVFVVAWLAYEYGHHRWDLSWPWLCLGNGFSGMLDLVQWYEFTGTLGGSFWILTVNILVYFNVFTSPETKEKRAPKWPSYSLIIALVVPVIASLVIKLLRTDQIQHGKNLKVAVLQPSFDPWTEKFVRNPLDLEQEMLQISTQVVDSSTDWLIWPETSLVSNIDMKNPEADPQIQVIKNDLFRVYPNLNLLTGVNGIEYYQSSTKPNRSARKSQYDENLWYNLFNSAMFMSKDQPIQIYHKSKLVPGTEQMPFIQTIPFLENLAISLDENSSTGSLGVSESAWALGSKTQTKTAPIICYESIYGDYVGEYIRNGAQWLSIVTNDAWWNQTAGYQQHFSYAKLRAIEYRKWVARSANTGTSGFINPLGNAVQSSSWYEKVCLQQIIYANDTKTGYYYLGDEGVLGILTLLILLASWIKNQWEKR